MTAIAIQHREEILQSIAAGKRLSDLSEVFKITPQAISKVLHSDPEYQVAIEVGHALRLDNAEVGIEKAKERVDVARAGAVWRAVSWRASVEVPHRWGAKQQMTVDVHHDVSDRLQADLSALLGRVVDTQQIAHRDSAEEGIGVMSSHDALPEGNTLTSAEHGVSPTMPEDDPVSP